MLCGAVPSARRVSLGRAARAPGAGVPRPHVAADLPGPRSHRSHSATSFQFDQPLRIFMSGRSRLAAVLRHMSSAVARQSAQPTSLLTFRNVAASAIVMLERHASQVRSPRCWPMNLVSRAVLTHLHTPHRLHGVASGRCSSRSGNSQPMSCRPRELWEAAASWVVLAGGSAALSSLGLLSCLAGSLTCPRTSTTDWQTRPWMI